MPAVISVLTLLCVLFGLSQCNTPHLSPFFFVCNYHGNTQNYGLDNGEVVVSVDIEGNPVHYIPGEFYHVRISSSEVFDNFLMTGLYTTPTDQKEAARLTPKYATGQNLMCSVVHSRVSPSPLQQIEFVWMAPPSGTGCVSFLATGTFNKQLLFKDTTVLQLCEYGASPSVPEQPELAEIHSQNVLLRDDFERDDEDLNVDIWGQVDGGYVGDDCGSVVHGKAAIFCDSVGDRSLVTVPLNLTSARVVQFTIGAGACRETFLSDPDIEISYGINSCTYWIPIANIRSPQDNKPQVHILSLPKAAKRENTCLKFSQPLTPEPIIKPPIQTKPTTESITITDMYSNSLKPTTTTTTTTTKTTTTSTITSNATSAAWTETIPSLTSETSKTTSLYFEVKENFASKPVPNSTAIFDNTEITENTGNTFDMTTNTTHLPSNASDSLDQIDTENSNSTAQFSGIAQDSPLTFQTVYHRCWAIDNVVVVNTANPPHSMIEHFDPIDPGNWIFFPGAYVKSQCQSDGNAFVFEDRNQSTTYAVTSDLDLSISDVKLDALLFEDFDSLTVRVNQTGGRTTKDCGEIHTGNALVMDAGKRRQMCTNGLILDDATTVHFYFSFGSEVCHSDGETPPVLVYLEDEHEQTFVLKTLTPHEFLYKQLVLFSLSDVTQSHRIDYNGHLKLCLLQKSHDGLGKDTWSIDSLAILPSAPGGPGLDKDKVWQLSINGQCQQQFGQAKSPTHSQVRFEYSTDLGEVWNQLYSNSKPKHFSVDDFTNTDTLGWQRVTFPLPFAVQSTHVRFRVVQDGDSDDAWAIDDVYVGECKEWCNGHGQCTENGCRCDFGYEGETCAYSIVPAPSNFHEGFEDPNLVGNSPLLDVTGATIGYHCGVLASGKALVFNKAGSRSITTAELNTIDISSVKFTLRIGSQSVTSKCPPAKGQPSPILLESSCNGGITWTQINSFQGSQYTQPVSISIPLKETSKANMCQFRWRQKEEKKQGEDVWAVDDIILVEKDLNSLSVHMMDMPDLGDRLTTNHGKLTDNFCERMRSLVFSSLEKNGEMRSLTTSSMRIGPGYIVQFDLVMGCGLPFTQGVDNRVHLNYSIDHGITWLLVQPACMLPQLCHQYSIGSVFHHTEYPQWKTVTLDLPEEIWGQEVRFRWSQPEWGETDVWAINRINIGPGCVHLCHGHGICHAGQCRCDKGFTGTSCEIGFQSDSTLHADFGPRYDLHKDFNLTGGEIVRAEEGCGTLLAGRSLYFSKAGNRQLVTKEINTKNADFLQFYIRIGGQGDGNCHGAERRQESVLLQYSNDSGIHWHLMKELHHLQYQNAKLFHTEIPSAAISGHTKFRWWQPINSGEGHDQWAVDEVLIGSYRHLKSLADDFESSLNVLESDQWRLITEGVAGKYCGSFDPSLVLGSQVNDKMVVTNDLMLNPGDVLQFEINVDCGKVFRWDHPVILQYSHDNGNTWKLVVEPCYVDQDCEGKLTEGSIYFTGTHGKWTLVVIPITPSIAAHPVIFKWWQQGGVENSFSLDNVYIGRPCVDNCHRRGLCVNEKCQCYTNQQVKYNELDCSITSPIPTMLLDRFDDSNMPSMLWSRIQSGHLGRGCGVIDVGNSLYFGGQGTREAVTHPIDTTHKRILEFTFKLGDRSNSYTCKRPRHRNEGIIVDYSTDNEITWNTLRTLEPHFDNSTAQTVMIELPEGAKNKETVFRFWQPLDLGGMPRAEWALDSVLIGVNASSDHSFEDSFTGMMPNPDHWFLADAAVQRPTCHSDGNALEFSGKKGMRVAETWDYAVTPSTFLQFDLAMGCGSLPTSLYQIQLEYSTDIGHSWKPVVDECIPPHFECSGYHVRSDYVSDQFSNWTRISVALPESAISPATRFRWIQPKENSKGTIWSIDNVFVGDSCPWLCSGHGVCHQGKCNCDPGFSGEFCVPYKPLPMLLKDDFNTDYMNRNVWRETVGGDNNDICGAVVSGNSMLFHKVGPRMAVTIDMDSSMLTGMEFHFSYGCGRRISHWPREQSVLLQYSTSGGIHWSLIKEIHFTDSQIKFYSIPLPIGAKHNATRFRFWQPKHGGDKQSVWSVDNLFIGSMAMRPSTLFEDFELAQPDDMAWLFINNGRMGEYCSDQTRHDSRQSGTNSLVFRRQGDIGEISVETQDMELGPMAVLQFDINVGCGSEPSSKYPVRLEYSTDGGLSWSLVGPNCGQLFGGRCFESGVPLTIYYAGESVYWRRIVMPLDHIQVCGSVRFRWFQGKIPDSDFAPEWSIDNVYIGMACIAHCNGHGSCIGGVVCDCDNGYGGPTCISMTPKPTYLKDDFEGEDNTQDFNPGKQLLQPGLSDNKKPIDETKWELWSGGRVVDNHPCGQVFEHSFFIHDNEGQRTLTTVPLDLSNAHSIQFHLKRGCSPNHSSSSLLPLYLQYSPNGGMSWTTIEQFHFPSNGTKHIKSDYFVSLHLPPLAQTNATQIRWWIPSPDGTYPVNWAIDQVYIGGNKDGQIMLQDDPGSSSEVAWIEHLGAYKEAACGSKYPVLHFREKNGKERFATSGDVIADADGIVQLTLSMGCDGKERPQCFSLELQYSLDLGQSWQILHSLCLPSSVNCPNPSHSSVFYSDVFDDWRRIAVTIPKDAWSSQTRFRVYQRSRSSGDQTWAISDMYIGSTCPNHCHNRGLCQHNFCDCDEGWNGTDCSIPTLPLPSLVSEHFTTDHLSHLTAVGGSVVYPCRTLSGHKVLHMHKNCSRQVETVDLDLSSGGYIQFYFMYGCLSPPTRRDEGVMLHYSVDGGITWNLITEMNYNIYRMPTLISVNIPQNARKEGVRVRLLQLENSGENKSDWLIDGFRIQADGTNPRTITSDWFNQESFPDNSRFATADNMAIKDYCGRSNVIVGNTPMIEASTLATREVAVQHGDIIQFSINVGCDHPWNSTIMPVTLEYSTDNGVSWHVLPSACMSSDNTCSRQDYTSSPYYHGTHNNWSRVVLPLNSFTVSNATRFRWRQPPLDNDDTPQSWAISDIYIGPPCVSVCMGNGLCVNYSCVCDEGYSNDTCVLEDDAHNPPHLKDTFDNKELNSTRFPWVVGGNVGLPCQTLSEGTALVMSGPRGREVITQRLDLRDARFVQYVASMWRRERQQDKCKPPPYDSNSNVILQYSNNKGLEWHTLHVLSPDQYFPHRRDYIILPPHARTNSTMLRWIQQTDSVSNNPSKPLVDWALEDVLIGGREINPDHYTQRFDDGDKLNDDPDAWEFNPYGDIQGGGDNDDDEDDDSGCVTSDDGKEGGAMVWKGRKLEDGGQTNKEDQFVTSQMIVQAGYLLQFKLNTGCGAILDVCDAPDAKVKLEYKRNPSSDIWHPVKPVCLPGNQKGGECNPLQHHLASEYSVSQFPGWTRVSIPLSQATYSSSTQFRWVQEVANHSMSWALDDVLIGDQCVDMCHGRGDCVLGLCQCDEGYYGPSCLPQASKLRKRLFESFEGGIFTSNWDLVTGGSIGFGCGALLPFAYGKSLYFNGCGERQAITVEMDTSYAIKIFFVIEIGCYAQTNECNIHVGDEKKYRGVLLQYSKNKGADWYLIAQHDAGDFLQPKKVAYDIPLSAKGVGTQFRWWQPQHDGKGFDQWAIDHVEIIAGRGPSRRYNKRWRG